MVGQLTAEDCDNIDHVRGRGWYLSSRSGKPYKTRKVGALCIFGNRTGGPAGKSGCAFHHLAARQGKHHTETKPFICWSVPLNFSSEEPEEPGGRDTTIVSAFTADAWGGTEDDEEADGRGHLGWWCIDTPDAYRGRGPSIARWSTSCARGSATRRTSGWPSCSTASTGRASRCRASSSTAGCR